MHDLLGAYQRIDRLYRLYIKSAFPLRYPDVANEREALLRRPGVLSQPPLIETVPVYPSSDQTLSEVERELPSEYAGFACLARTLMPEGVALYDHQRRALRAVIGDGKDLVITTGTGSGKTESFLLPLLAQLARESNFWPAMAERRPGQEWWRSDGRATRVTQWQASKRPAAMRALVLYPLNALVEDQLRRLRRTLEHADVHAWLDQERGGNRITFGRYTGQTPVAGKESPERLGRLRARLRTQDQQRLSVQASLRSEATLTPELEDLLFHFPRLDGGEMWSRWDMQETPPDILITNYSMLNIMLMRSIESTIFDQTAAWLAEPGHPERQFTLIVDELHVYRGTPGTEVAYVLRLLLQRLGLTPDSHKLRILATSASFTADDRGRAFLREFFGRDRFALIGDHQLEPRAGARLELAQHAGAFERFAQAVQPDPEIGPPAAGAAVQAEQHLDALAADLGGTGAGTGAERIAAALGIVAAVDALRDACRTASPDGTVRPTRVGSLDKVLFPHAPLSDQAVASDALRGLLLALGMSRQRGLGRSPQPLRGHLFFHNMQNLWACSNPSCTQRESFAGGTNGEREQRTIGALHATHRLACGCGARVLDLIVCEVCGDIFLGGYRGQLSMANGASGGVILTPDQPDLESMPDRTVLARKHGQYAVFWPLPGAQSWSVAPVDEAWTRGRLQHRWERAKLEPDSGYLTLSKVSPKPGEVAGWVYQVRSANAAATPMAAIQPALPGKCPRCDADYSHRRQERSPLRNHRTGFQKGAQVLASALFREMTDSDTGDLDRPERKLVIFSDSRQDAAKLAAGIELDHYRDMVRLALVRAFEGYWGEFESFLRDMLTTNPDGLPRLGSVNPELAKKLARPLTPCDLERSRQFQAANSRLNNEALLWFMGRQSFDTSLGDDWLSLLRDYGERVPLRELTDRMRDRLLQQGICPGGAGEKEKRFWQGHGATRE